MNFKNIKIVKLIFYFIITYTGFIFVLRWLNQKLFGNQIIILYTHRIIDKSDELYPLLKALDYLTIAEFEKRIKYLRRHYRFISLPQAMECLKKGDITGNSVLLTFDDGYKCNYLKAFPILKKYNIPVTIFVSTDSVNSQNILWHDKLISAIGFTRKQQFKIKKLSEKVFKVRTLKEKKNSYQEIGNLLKRVDNIEKVIIVDEIIKILEVTESVIAESNSMLSWDEIRKMRDSGLVSFGSHTVTHPILTKISIEQLKEEILHSKKIIEQHIGDQVKFFAYPSGKYNVEVENAVKSCGYEAAFNTDENFKNNSFRCFSFGRQGFIHENFCAFAVRVAGVLDLVRSLLNEIKKAHPWVINYGLGKVKEVFIPSHKGEKHIFLCISDHFEPLWGGVDEATGSARVKTWCEKLPDIARKYKDSDGCHPKYTFFYPIEEYKEEYLDSLSDLCRKGFGEVEIHLHHDNDTSDNLRKRLIEFKNVLADKHSLLSKDKRTNEIKYGFIHGNWALDNSRPDGRWCGINNEIEILQKTGCYADLTMPSAPDLTQTTKINSIYYAVENPDKPKSHNYGKDAEKGKNHRKGLLMIQGPLMLNWKKRKWGVFPQIENSSLSDDSPVSLGRIKLWLDANIHVKNSPNHIFIKLYTHGCQEKNLTYLLNKGLNNLFSHFQDYFNDTNGYKIHYVSAREMVNIIKALENNEIKNDIAVNKYRDYRFETLIKGKQG